MSGGRDWNKNYAAAWTPETCVMKETEELFKSKEPRETQ